ncbi:hypothetical protein TOPH_04361 [Tolypocladium ophioglossoides CBS 100239]|uniref:Uncharacterized protein n=1 Tax=Tolypocladium ophioglossoides (strain CBS 100239) TaxID=1163406 RepID=A0A0L0NA90_TOLOC|nr:hypothetical protein TOPH_04361 [Tolypocladium ophioglossoides CBS 100239]
MLPFRIPPPGALTLTRCMHTPPRQARAQLPRLRLPLQRHIPRRCYAQSNARPANKGGRVKEEDLKRQAKTAAQSGKHYEIPERLIIYHAGTGRTTFLAMLKLTSIFIGAFFTFVVVPGYVKSDKPWPETAGVVLCGVLPLAFVAYTTAPFVTHIHIHLPASARASRPALERFVAALPPSAQLTLTTMSLIAKPRYSSLRAGDLAPARRRLGVVNYARDTAGENEGRRWYNLRAVGQFYVQDKVAGGGKGRRVRYQKKGKGVVDTWIWDALRDKIATRAAAKPS